MNTNEPLDPGAAGDDTSASAASSAPGSTPEPAAAQQAAATPAAGQSAPDAPTAPDAAAAPAAPAGTPIGSRQGAWVAIVLVVVGALVGLGTFGQSLWDSIVTTPRVAMAEADGDGDSGWGWGGGWDEDMSVVFSDSVAVDDITALTIDARSSEVIVQFDDVDEAELEVRSSSDRFDDWDLDADEGTLTLSENNRDGGGPGWNRTQATLTLPLALEDRAIELDARIRSGAMSIFGDFGAVALDVQSGAGSFDGAADTLDVTLSSGAFDVTAVDVREAALTVGSGVLNATLTGEQPASITLDVNSGAAHLSVPVGDYAVSGSASSGAREISVGTDPAATSTLEVNVDSGFASVD